MNIKCVQNTTTLKKEIDYGNTEQYTASVDIGKTLKELYIDSV